MHAPLASLLTFTPPSPPGWYEYGTNEYRIFGEDNKHYFHQAQAFCELLDADLASIEDRMENAFISHLVTELTGLLSVWVGGIFDPSFNLRWVDGKAQGDFTKPYLPGEPDNNLKTAEACLLLDAQDSNGDRTGRWDARTCKSYRAFGKLGVWEGGGEGRDHKSEIRERDQRSEIKREDARVSVRMRRRLLTHHLSLSSFSSPQSASAPF